MFQVYVVSPENKRISPALNLEHFVHARSRDFQAADGLGKRFFLIPNENEEKKLLFSAEMHPRSGTEALYYSGGSEIVRYIYYIYIRVCIESH